MKIFVNRDIKRFFIAVSAILLAFLLLARGAAQLRCQELSLLLPILSLLTAGAVWAVSIRYFNRQNDLMEQAVSRINEYLAGNVDARIECDEEGELYRLFHSVNSLAAVLNAHADHSLREKEFLKNMISDVSHQLKTPLAALNIYNGLMQGEAERLPAVKELADLSERELDRMEMLVQSLLTITKLDAGSIVMEKDMENVADMLRDVELQFAHRARQERKELVLSGPDEAALFCDRDWLIEAVGNIVKNALDHTGEGDTIRIEWKAMPSAVQVTVKDSGGGIHPEDLHHIFKRFYRSRFSKDRQGVGLGLPLAKGIIEAHSGTIEVDSELGRGTAFTMNFLNTANSYKIVG